MTKTAEFPAVVLSSVLGEHCRRWGQRESRRWKFLVRDIDSMKAIPTSFLYVATLGELDEDTGRALRKQLPEGIIILDLGMPCEAIPERLRRLGTRLVARTHLKATDDMDELREFLMRLRSVVGSRSSSDSILDAWWEEDTLVVLSSTLDRLRVPFTDLQHFHVLRDASRTGLEEFEIDADGTYVHWPSRDVHMTWECFEQLVNPKALLRAQQRSARFNRRYGKAVRVLRTESGLRQSDIPGLDERHVRRIEQGEQRATLSALRKLARAHSLSVTEYMNALAERT